MAATTTTKRPSSVRVRGVTYRNPDEALVAADELEHRADELAGELRARGKDGEADTLQDRGHADAERLRAFARDREAAEAAATDQPADRPTSSSSSTTGRRKSSRRRRRPSVRAGGSALTPATRELVAATGIPAASSSATSLLIRAAGLTIAIAFLTLALTRRGSSAFADLAGAGANGLSWLLSPTDPLAPHPHQGASSSAASYARSGAGTRRATRGARR